MDREDQLAELFGTWQAAKQRGAPLTTNEVCRDCPDLLPEFEAILPQLAAVNALFDDTEPSIDSPISNQHDEIREFRGLVFHKQGGLGIVQSGEEIELGRTVAIKRMKPRVAVDAAARQRFVEEAELTAKLEHPGIVPIYRKGADGQGRPYYAMRFIQGKTLGDAIRALHSTDSKGVHLSNHASSQNTLEFRRLLRDVVSICQTMAYAHSRGVIHRDLKPENVMLGPFGETLVLDWGLAKQFSPARGIAAGQRTSSKSQIGDKQPATSIGLSNAGEETIGMQPEATPARNDSIVGKAKGSPAFMSPEQARGDWAHVGPASDIYSLGATLYMLLTGATPFSGDSIEAVLDRVKAGDFAAPRELNPQVNRALEAICLKAMSLVPANRYPSAIDMAADVERYLADEPVSAWREPLAIRSRRWLRRHRTLASVTAAALLVGALGLAALAVLERHKNQQLQVAYDELSDAKLRVERNYRLARDAARGLAESSSGIRGLRQLNHVFLASDFVFPEESVQGLREARDAFRALQAADPSDTDSLEDLAAVNQQLGLALASRGKSDQALAAFAESRQLLEQLQKSGANFKNAGLGLVLVELAEGTMFVQESKAVEGGARLRRALEIADSLAAELNDDPEFRQVQAYVWHNLACVEAFQQKPKDAVAWFEKARKEFAELEAKHPELSRDRTDRQRADFVLGTAYSMLAVETAHTDLSAALKKFEQAQSLLHPLARQQCDFPYFRQLYERNLQRWAATVLASAKHMYGRSSKSEIVSHIETALPVWETLRHEEPHLQSVQSLLEMLRVGLAESARERIGELDANKPADAREVRRLLQLALNGLDQLPIPLLQNDRIKELSADLRIRLNQLPITDPP